MNVKDCGVKQDKSNFNVVRRLFELEYFRNIQNFIR